MCPFLHEDVRGLKEIKKEEKTRSAKQKTRRQKQKNKKKKYKRTANSDL